MTHDDRGDRDRDRDRDDDRRPSRAQRDAERRREAPGRGGLSPNGSQHVMRERRAGRWGRGRS